MSPNRGTAPPPYPRRATFLTPGEQAEFGVGTVQELVALLNLAWESEGRRPLAFGSYPTNRILLRFVLSEARLAMRKGLIPGSGVPASQA